MRWLRAESQRPVNPKDPRANAYRSTFPSSPKTPTSLQRDDEKFREQCPECGEAKDPDADQCESCALDSGEPGQETEQEEAGGEGEGGEGGSDGGDG